MPEIQKHPGLYLMPVSNVATGCPGVPIVFGVLGHLSEFF